MFRGAIIQPEMARSPGSHVGPYEIISAIGAGGMGEVYRARDAKLGRDVAIKILPDVFAYNSERMARFQREAKVLASLSHTNIASIYGLEDSSTTHALVMELIEGLTLADRIKSGPIPISEALPIAKQMCEALEYAHEHGIVHRDLKPANVKVTNEDAVKVLDFGLAKALEGDASSIDIANSPTVSRMATQAGVLLGTGAYMSPEQAKGKAVDRRADIWAFGCVLYEMLTGKMAFRGESVTDTLAAVIRADPDWSQLPAATPVRVRVLLQRCLQKDPKQRLQAIGDARIALEEVLSGVQDPTSVPATARPAKRRWLWPSVAAACIVISIAGWLAFLYLRPKAPTAQVQRFEIPLPEKTTPRGYFALSPDGSKLAFVASDTNGQSRVWVRSIETLDARPLDGTEGATDLPFWSPDSRFIAFPAQGKLKKIESVGGPPVTLCDASSVYGGAWTNDDEIIFGSNAGLFQVSASGGSPSPVTTDGASTTPSILPDGRHFVYLHASGQGGSTGIYVGSVDTKPQGQPSKRLLADYSGVVYAPSSDPAVGYLLFVRGASPSRALGTLMVQRFDTRRLELTREAVPIAEQVSFIGFSASATDVLVYVKGTQTAPTGGVRGIIQGQLTWFDREGKVLGTVGDPGSYRTLAISPDGKRVAFDRADSQNSGTRNIWLYEFARGVTTRFTFDPGVDVDPVWAPDGSRIAFGSSRSGTLDLYQKASNLAGDDELLFKSSEAKVPGSWSPDGRFLLYYLPLAPNQIWLLPLGVGGADRKPVPFAKSEFNQAAGRFSPDGHWVAYSSNESGRDEIYVRPFDASSATGSSPAGGTPVTGKWMASKDGGTTPLWRRDGKELFYMSLDGSAMAVDVSTSGVFQAEIPKALFKVPRGELFWDVSSDGKRFLMAAPSDASASAPAPFTVVLNWQAGLNK
jgi:eukaryotic-like serine/threonine-protein kinase